MRFVLVVWTAEDVSHGERDESEGGEGEQGRQPELEDEVEAATRSTRAHTASTTLADLQQWIAELSATPGLTARTSMPAPRGRRNAFRIVAPICDGVDRRVERRVTTQEVKARGNGDDGQKRRRDDEAEDVGRIAAKFDQLLGKERRPGTDCKDHERHLRSPRQVQARAIRTATSGTMTYMASRDLPSRTGRRQT